MAKVFSTGTLTIDGVPVGDLTDIQIKVGKKLIPAPTNKEFPDAIARGQGQVKGTAKSGSWNSALIASITNAVMGPIAAADHVALVWTVTDDAGASHTLTFPNIVISDYTLGAGADKWLAHDISFECGAGAGTDANKVMVVT